LVVGAGLAGLSAALDAARAGAEVLVLTPEHLFFRGPGRVQEPQLAAVLVLVRALEPEQGPPEELRREPGSLLA
jgi:L-aspartate oxidase